MPKKFQGENSRSVVAKARKNEKLAIEKVMKEKAIEDASWEEDDKLINKKKQRKEDREKKKLEDVERKRELKLLEESEKILLVKPAPAQKVTAFQLQKDKEMQLCAGKEKCKSILDEPLVENLNRVNGIDDQISASGLDAAVAALSMSSAPSGTKADGEDKHPEKRMAAAFKAFETEQMPILKKQNPTLRLSQLNQKLRKDWKKSSQNPLNKLE